MYYVKLKEGPDKDRVEKVTNGYIDGHVTMREAWNELCATYLRRKDRLPLHEVGGHCHLAGKWVAPHVHADFDEALDCYVGNWGEEGADHLITFHLPHYALIPFSGSQRECTRAAERLNRNRDGEVYEVRYEY